MGKERRTTKMNREKNYEIEKRDVSINISSEVRVGKYAEKHSSNSFSRATGSVNLQKLHCSNSNSKIFMVAYHALTG